ncbi:hypothetical protein ALMP_73140 [Streptomyces sp. A012304]|nr:hypothetical protein ALMP_73140 [Streptomyces sp. A012304]
MLELRHARRSTIHLPRLTAARAQAQRPLKAGGGLSRLQTAALTTHIAQLDHTIADLAGPSVCAGGHCRRGGAVVRTPPCPSDGPFILAGCLTLCPARPQPPI